MIRTPRLDDTVGQLDICIVSTRAFGAAPAEIPLP
jgi:hypothetical protein